MERYPFDDEYVRRLKEGDPETERHFDSFFRPLLRVKLRGQRLRGRRPEEDEIGDLSQDVFYRVLRAVKKGLVRDGKALGGFVFMVCKHIVQEYNRSPVPEQFDETNAKHDLPVRADDAETVLINNETYAKARQVVDGPERDAQIVRAIYLEDRDKDEVCAEFGILRSNLRVVLHRALKRFREEL